jgi:hypothetical protein
MAGIKVKKPNGDINKQSLNSLKIKKPISAEKPATEEKSADTDGLSPKQMLGWNNFLSFLDKKGLKGKPELEKDNLGNDLFKQWVKDNPNEGLTEQDIPKVRKSYSKVRDIRLKEIKEGKGAYKEGTNEENFMSFIVENEKSKDPNYVGRRLTQTPFPGTVLNIKDEKGNIVEQRTAKPSMNKSSDTLNKLKKN